MSKIFISEKQIISIHYFMENYLGIKYDGYRKLTHDELDYFLCEKGLNIVKRARIQDIKKQDNLVYKYLYVKDEFCKVVPYFNPKYNIQFICNDVISSSDKIIELRERREKILESMGYKYDKFGSEVIKNDCVNIAKYVEEIDDQEEEQVVGDDNIYLPVVHVNRTKQMVRYGTRGSYYR